MANKYMDGVSSIDQFLTKNTTLGSQTRAISDNIWGINTQGIPAMVPSNKDVYGLVFFTRPQLNLKSANLRNDRRLYNFLTTLDYAMAATVRQILDPRLFYSSNQGTLADPKQAFISVLTNDCRNISGWPDEVLPTFTSKEGVRREQWIIGDGSIDLYDAFNIEATFANTQNEPITAMMHVWITYISRVFEGMLSPYMDFILENEIDYNTRIYRLVLDETKRYVKKISATGASFPVNNSIGRFFDFNQGVRYNDQTKDISVRFYSVGALYFDDILIKEFNSASGIFNPSIRELIRNGSSSDIWKVPEEYKSRLANRGYMYINPKTLELETYVDKNNPEVQNIINEAG